MATINKDKCLLFGIDLKNAPNEEWYLQGYQEALKGKQICNFNKKVTLYGIFDGVCNAKVLNWKSTNYIFSFPYDRELLASILYEIEYNYATDGVAKKSEIYSKYGSQLDLLSYSDSFNYEIIGSEVGSIWVTTDRDERKIHITVFTSIYNNILDDIRSNNCVLLGENPEDAYKEKTDDVDEVNSYYLDLTDMESDEVQKTTEENTYFVNIRLDDEVPSVMFSASALLWHSKSDEPMPCKLIKLDSLLSIFYGENEDKRVNIVQPQLRSFLPAGEIIEAWIVNSCTDDNKYYRIKFVCINPQTKKTRRICTFLSGKDYEMDTIEQIKDRTISICVDTTGGVYSLIAARNALSSKMGTEEGKAFVLRQEYGSLVSATDMEDFSFQFLIDSDVLYDYLGNGGTWLGMIDDVYLDQNQNKPSFRFFIINK